MQKFLDSVANRIINDQFLGIENTVILPNRRAGLFLQKSIGEQIDRPVFLPKIMPIEEFFFETSGLIRIEPTEQLFRLYDSHKSVMQSPDTFDQFLNWAQTFLNDCNEIDTNLIDTEEFFALLYQDREIRNWNLGAELTSIQKEYLEFWKTAKDLYKNFTSHLLNEGKAYNGLAYRFVIEHIERLFQSRQKNSLLFVGFNALNRAEEALFDFVSENGFGHFAWDTDDYYINNKVNKAGQYFRAYQEKWDHNDLQRPKQMIGRTNQQIEIIQAPNHISQCEIASLLIREMAKEHSLGSETAIILADEQLLEPLLYRLPPEHSYNITMGKSLLSFPLFHLFDQLVHLFHTRINENDFLTTSLSPILHSSYLKKLNRSNEHKKILEFIINTNSSSINSEAIDHLLAQDSIYLQILNTKNDLESIFRLFHQIIEQLRIEYLQEEGRLTIQLLFEIKKIFQQLESLLSNYSIDISLSSMRALFRQVCSSTSIPYDGDPLKGVQIMGVLETRCLDFERIILLSANESILPKGRQQNSFIPFIFKHHFQIQTFKDKDAIYAYTFYRLLHYCNQNTFIYNGLEGKHGEKSRFIQQLEAEFPVETSISNKIAGYQSPTWKNREYKIEKTDEIIERIENYIETKGLSPSTINSLVRSPIDFYFQRIAGIREQKELEQEIENNTFGTIVHNSLETIYKPIENKIIDKEFLDYAKDIHEDVVEHELNKIYGRGNTLTGVNFLYVKAAKRIVYQSILFDTKRIKTFRLKLIEIEKNLSCKLPLTIHGKQYNVKFSGKADRIQYRDDSIEIIDYKTGSVYDSKMKTKWIPEIHDNIDTDKLQQILCYSLMAWHGEKYSLESIRGAMQPLKSWNTGLVYLNQSPYYALTELDMQNYVKQIELILEQLLNPEIPFVPEEEQSKLRYSKYKRIYL